MQPVHSCYYFQTLAGQMAADYTLSGREVDNIPFADSATAVVDSYYNSPSLGAAKMVDSFLLPYIPFAGN